MATPNTLSLAFKTPVISIDFPENSRVNLYAKCEYHNPTGSIKDRSADYVLKQLLATGTINPDTTIIESSSGNFGIALTAYCRLNGLKFIGVIDKNISPINEMLMKSMGANIIKIEEADQNGGYLLNRIKKIETLLKEHSNYYWINQYANPLIPQAYYHTIGPEIQHDFPKIDYVFVGVSSGGTITGISQRIKADYPAATVIAVDIYGSVVFGGDPKKRYIPGIGSSMVPTILKEARIDEVVWVSEADTVITCNEMLRKDSIFAGGSSGSVIAAIKQYFRNRPVHKTVNVLTFFPDKGERYINTVYDRKWCQSHFNLSIDEPVSESYALNY